MAVRRLLRVELAFFTLVLFSGILAAQSEPTPSQTQANPAPQQTAPPAATQEQPSPVVTFRESVRRVIVDVTVRDASGKPVHGLTAGDFSISEDKQPQRVLSFDAYDLDKRSISRRPNAPPLPPDVFENIPTVPERGPLYVILFDMVNMAAEDEMWGRQQALKFINSKPEGTRFAVFVTTDKLRLVQGFSADKDQLYATLDGKHPKSHVPKVFLYGRNYGRGDEYTTVDMLTHIGEYLDGIPGRKNLIWIGGPFPLAVYPRDYDPADLQQAVKAEINALAQAQIAVYPVDVRGVSINGASTGGQPGSRQALPAGAGVSLNGDYVTEDAIASMTGGRAFYSANDVTSALEQATEDGGNYYTLTYSPPSQADDGKCHNISVKLNQGSYQLSYRQQYCRVPLVSTEADEEDQDKSKSNTGASTLAIPLQAGDVLQGNIKPGAPMLHDLVFSAHMQASSVALATSAQMEQLQMQAAFFRTQRRNRPPRPLAPVKIQTYTIDYRVLDPEFKPQAAFNGKPRALEFAVAAFDEDGKVLDGIVNDGVQEASTQASDNKTGLFRMRQSLVVPVNAKFIRVGVRDRANNRMGTLEVALPLAPEPVAKK